jgi:hypothetical protein
MRSVLPALLGCALLVGPLTGCSAKEASKDDVCSTFTELGNQVIAGNGVFDATLLQTAGTLGDQASRFSGQPDLSQDAGRLKDISKLTSTDTPALLDATQHIAQLCGHPLGGRPIQS